MLPPSLRALGLWIEQLVAESTGKHGKGALPVVDEPLGRPDEYGNDRAFVAIATDRDAPDAARLQALEDAGHPVLRLSTRIDGARRRVLPLGIRDRGRRRRARHQSVRRAERRRGQGEDEGDPRRKATSPAARPVAVRRRRVGLLVALHRRARRRRSSAAAIESLGPRDYVAFLSYLPADAGDRTRPSREIRERDPRADARREHVRRRARAICTRPASTTRAGRTRRVAFVITGEDATQTPIPDAPLHVLAAEARAGGRRLPDARGARPPHRADPFRPRRRSGGGAAIAVLTAA